MKKFIKRVLIISLVLSFSTTTIAKETITIASNGNASPGWSEYSKHYGYILHIAAEAFILAGIQIKIEWYPWKRAFKQAKYGMVDGTCCWFFVEERTQDFYYSNPVAEETQVFFHLKSFNFDWKTVDDLRGMTIGGNTGFNYEYDLEKAEKTGKIIMERVTDYDQNLKKLLAGRIQLYPGAVITVYDHLHTIFPPKTVDLLTYHPKPVLKKPLHLLLPKTMEKERALRILASFNQGLQHLKDNGKYHKILKDAENGVYKKMDEKWMPSQK
ncbi:transporter substrate-binding domain-containing protein [bacterium]|nr:transporter substrate-binding domain-containing protein [bacterium]